MASFSVVPSGTTLRQTSSFGIDHFGNTLDLTQVIFDKHDLDSSGCLNKEEFHEFIYSMGRYMDEQESEAAWTFIELNGDGRIVFHEFLLWWESKDRWGLLALTDEQKLALYQVSEYFTYYDEDRSGTLTWEEFYNVYQYMMICPSIIIQEI